ncbi:hypothetical protein J4732_15100 [Serratia marcescens]|uniref:Uncharacterized protein n=1 Tax=Serratia marcescens TaxID=615 RepID=A0A939NMD7_SERMA|nr:hypothetical protein [Serratia marcescens]
MAVAACTGDIGAPRLPPPRGPLPFYPRPGAPGVVPAVGWAALKWRRQNGDDDRNRRNQQRSSRERRWGFAFMVVKTLSKRQVRALIATKMTLLTGY